MMSQQLTQLNPLMMSQQLTQLKPTCNATTAYLAETMAMSQQLPDGNSCDFTVAYLTDPQLLCHSNLPDGSPHVTTAAYLTQTQQ